MLQTAVRPSGLMGVTWNRTAEMPLVTTSEAAVVIERWDDSQCVKVGDAGGLGSGKVLSGRWAASATWATAGGQTERGGGWTRGGRCVRRMVYQ